ncbi:MAG: DUF1294 domain-containing protein [Bacteroidales bacterium]|nr:DUF1294 domain-containing protein [Bacteroidales bacterium]
MVAPLWCGLLVAVNVFTLLLYGADKRRAMRKRRRIPEAVLLWAAFLGGSVGALAGMRLFRHKTKHRKFTVAVPLFLLLHVAVWCYSHFSV